MGTHSPFSNTATKSIMKFFAVASALFVAVASEAQLPIVGAGLYGAGTYGYATPYAAAYAPAAAAVAVDAKFAYGQARTALNAGPLTAGSIATPAVASFAAAPAVATYAAAAPAIAAPVAATYAAAPAVATVAAPAVATYAAAAPAIAAPVAAAYAAAAPIAAPASSQFQAQDEFGNVAYGYQNINSAKQESGNAYGGVTGSYTYADEAGVHTVNYVADALGFRVAGDNLPIGPIDTAVAPVHTVAPVVDTPEVVEAKAAFFQAYEAAKSGIVKREAQVLAAPAAYAGYGYAAPAAYAGYGYAAPVAATYAGVPAVAATYAAAPAVAATYAAAPAVAASYAAAPVAAAAYAAPAAPARDAILTTIKLNPGHATFYRVD